MLLGVLPQPGKLDGEARAAAAVDASAFAAAESDDCPGPATYVNLDKKVVSVVFLSALCTV